MSKEAKTVECDEWHSYWILRNNIELKRKGKLNNFPKMDEKERVM